MTTQALLQSLERQVWDALVAGDAAADRALLSPDFLGVYPSGFATAECHAAQLAAGPSVITYRMEAIETRILSEYTGLIAYLAHYTRPDAPETELRMYVSSIWRQDAGGWRNIFSQDTDASE
ncbi:MAG: nuclear transport factor 2 family protein [Pseudomonadota bacterium]